MAKVKTKYPCGICKDRFELEIQALKCRDACMQTQLMWKNKLLERVW